VTAKGAGTTTDDRKGETAQLIGAIVPQVLICPSPDMRYRLPADMLLACFAARLRPAPTEADPHGRTHADPAAVDARFV
jgi:hypothetical protein